MRYFLILLSFINIQAAQAATAPRLVLLSECDRELQSSDESFLRLMSIALSIAGSDAIKAQILKRILDSAMPVSIFASTRNSSELQIDLALRPLLKYLSVSQWQNVQAVARGLVKSVADQIHDKGRQDNDTSHLLGLVHLPENDIDFEGAVPAFLDMGDYELSADHMNAFRVYKIHKDTGFREVIGSEPFGMFLHYPIMFRRGKNEALAISLSAGFQIHVMKVTDKKISVIQNFELRDANRVGHFRLPDGRDIVTVQTDTRINGVETYKMNLYEVGADGNLDFKWRIDLAKKMTQMQLGNVVATEQGPVLNMYALTELGFYSHFTLHLDSLVFKQESTGLLQFHRKPFEKVVMKDGRKMFFASNANGIALFGEDPITGLPIVTDAKIKYWEGFKWSGQYFEYKGIPYLAVSGAGEIGVFEIVDSKTVTEVARYTSGQNTMHGFGIHETADNRFVIATSIGDAVQLFEFTPGTGLHLADEISGGLQSQHPHFTRTSDGKDDFVFLTRGNRLETFRLKKKLEKLGASR